MEENNVSQGYYTYILGTVEEINQCLRIAVYNRRAFDQISLYNINEIYNSLGDAKIELVRNDILSPFEYIIGDLESGFNVIIYLSEYSVPLGYTEFYSDQGTEFSVNITIGLQDTISAQDNVTINLDLSKYLRGTGDTYRQFTGKTFKSISDILEEKIKKDFIYTSDLTNHKNIIYQGIRSSINNELYGLYITRDVDIDPKKVGYSNYNFGFKGNDIVLYSWTSEGKYRATSLTKNDIFGNPLQYSAGEYTGDIQYMSGRYIIGSDRIYNYLTKEETLGEYIIDQQDWTGKVIKHPDSLESYEEVIVEIPDLKDIYIDLKTFMSYQTLRIHRKIGSWWILEHTERGRKAYAVTNSRALIYMTKEEVSNLFVINSGSLLVKDQDTYNLYMIDSPGYYITESTKKYMKNSSGSWQLPKYVKSKSMLQDPFEIKVGDDLYKTMLFNYRIGPYINTVPNFIGSMCGVLFYKEGDNLFYL